MVDRRWPSHTLQGKAWRTSHRATDPWLVMNAYMKLATLRWIHSARVEAHEPVDPRKDS
jgi:hypothetical protein